MALGISDIKTFLYTVSARKTEFTMAAMVPTQKQGRCKI